MKAQQTYTVVTACRLSGQDYATGERVALGADAAKYPLLEGKIEPVQQAKVAKQTADKAASKAANKANEQ